MQNLKKPNKHHAKLLIVEDDPLNQIIIGSLLTQLGYKYDIAKDGKQALSLALSSDYKLIFMDIGLPDMSGLEVTTVLRSNNTKNSCIPIVALTAHEGATMREKCISAGMDEFVSKPISMEHLKLLTDLYLK